MTDAEETARRVDAPDGPDGVAGEAAERSGPPSKLARNLVVGPLIVMVIATNLGTILFSVTVKDHPLWLLALNPSNRNLVFTSKLLGAPGYYAVGFARLMAPDPLFYLLGIWYGDAAVRWMERRSPTYGGLFRQLEQWFHKARYPIVMIAPNNPVCLLAGASGMSVVGFAAADVIGTIGRLWLFRVLGNFLNTPVSALRDFASQYRYPLLAVSIAVVALTIWSERRKGHTQIDELLHIDDEMRVVDADPAGPAGAEATPQATPDVAGPVAHDR